MSEAPKKTQFMKVTSKDLTRFFSSVNASEVCPVCGNTSWSVILAPEREVFTVISLPESGNMLQSRANIPLIAIACNQCYFVRFHAAIPLTEWLEQNPVPEANQEETE